MTPSRTVYLLYGPTAAGKSTVAMSLAKEHLAVRFAIDDWMHALFASDMPPRMELSWAMTRVARCQAVMWEACKQILDCGTDVVLELGLLRHCDRESMRAKVMAAGHSSVLCFIDADINVRRQRVLQRNQDKGETYAFHITPGMFDAMESVFERPDSDELKRSTVVVSRRGHE